MKSEVCVIGGGPAGLAAAIMLSSSGREVTVLDCATPPIDKPCGEGLMPDSLESLKKLGVQVPKTAASIHGIRFVGTESQVTGDFPNGAAKGLRRILLHEALISRAEAIGVRMLWGVKNIQTRRGRVSFGSNHIDTQLIVGADGHKSLVRQAAGLDEVVREQRRYGFRQHYAGTGWPPYVEVYWSAGFQIYVTPVAQNQICVALISRDPHLRLQSALRRLPNLEAKLRAGVAATSEKGGLSVSRTFRRVYTDGYALIGDASGSVDAITGEGMCLAFKQAAALTDALNAGDLSGYQRAHRKLLSRPMQMAALMLVLDKNRTLQRKALAALQAHPRIFASILGAHVGHSPLTDVVSWELLPFGLGVLSA